MAFLIRTDDGEVHSAHTDDESFEIINGGVLKVARADGSFTYLSPAVWASIDEYFDADVRPEPAQPVMPMYTREDAAALGVDPDFDAMDTRF